VRAHHELSRLSRPGKEIGAGLKRIKLPPENQTDRLKHVASIFPVSGYCKDICVELAVVACNQIREQIVAILYVHELISSLSPTASPRSTPNISVTILALDKCRLEAVFHPKNPNILHLIEMQAVTYFSTKTYGVCLFASFYTTHAMTLLSNSCAANRGDTWSRGTTATPAAAISRCMPMCYGIPIQLSSSRRRT
jgi:hypothetical protein